LANEEQQAQNDSRADDIAKRNFAKTIAPKLNSQAFLIHRGAN
jgi:hypothetical protein